MKDQNVSNEKKHNLRCMEREKERKQLALQGSAN